MSASLRSTLLNAAAARGTVVSTDKIWLSNGTKDFRATVAQIAEGLDSSTVTYSELFLDATRYGVVADGITDNRAAIQAALAATALTGHKCLYFPASALTYNFSGTVIVPPGVTIKGVPGNRGAYQPWTGDPYGSILHYTGATGIGLWVPVSSRNLMLDFELAGNPTTTATGIAFGSETFLDCTTTNTNAVVVSTGFSGLPIIVGMYVFDGTGGTIIPAGTTVTAIAGNNITLSNPATASGAQTGINGLVFRHPAYHPIGAHDYPGFGGEHVRVKGCYVHDFRRNVFTHYLDGFWFEESSSQNATHANLWFEKAFNHKLRYPWVGGHDTNSVYGNALNTSIGLRVIDDAGVGIIWEGGDLWNCTNAIQVEWCRLHFNNVNVEATLGAYLIRAESADVLAESLRLGNGYPTFPFRLYSSPYRESRLFYSGVTGEPVAQTNRDYTVFCLDPQSTQTYNVTNDAFTSVLSNQIATLSPFRMRTDTLYTNYIKAQGAGLHYWISGAPYIICTTGAMTFQTEFAQVIAGSYVGPNRPTFGYLGDETTGIGHLADGEVTVVCNGVDKLVVTATATSTPKLNATAKSTTYPLAVNLSDGSNGGLRANGLGGNSDDLGFSMYANGARVAYVASSFVQQEVDLIPFPDNGIALGSASRHWSSLYVGTASISSTLAVTGASTFSSRINLASYTVATLPAAGVAGGEVYCSNAGGNGPCIGLSNGTNWKRCDNTGTTIS